LNVNSYELTKSYHSSNIKFHPFVKWAGGKSRLLSSIRKYIPKTFSNYFEPFLGGGALFFYLKSINQGNESFVSFLSDINNELITTYKVIKKNPQKLISLLKEYERNYFLDPKQFYYKLRDKKISDNLHLAARFITLNKTCYNGLYRVNKNNFFNVPIGTYKNPKICDENNLSDISNLLNKSNTKFQIGDYEDILLNNAKPNDFIYLDPPYNPIDQTSNFTSYTQGGFDTYQQKRLSNMFIFLDNKECKIILSNSDTELIRELYKDYIKNINEIESLRSINSKPERRSGHKELIIKNF
jgi:DNA adenine methylase